MENRKHDSHTKAIKQLTLIYNVHFGHRRGGKMPHHFQLLAEQNEKSTTAANELSRGHRKKETINL